MIRDRFFKWVDAETERLSILADRKIRLRKQAAVNEDEYDLITELVKEVSDLEQLKKNFLNHKPSPEDSNYLDYVPYFIAYGSEIEKY